MSSKKKSQPSAQAADPSTKVRTPPLEGRRIGGAIGGVLVAVLGLAAVLAGVAISIGPDYVAELEPWVARSIDLGLRADVLAMGGIVLLAVAWAARTARENARTLLEPGLAVSYLDDLTADMSLLQNMAHELLGNTVEQGVQVSTLRKELLEHRQEMGVANPKDALFRLAASLDQLGARIDSRIGEATAAVCESTESVTGAIESARNSVLDSVEHSARELSEIVYDAAQTLASAPEDDTMQPEPARGAPQYRLVEDDDEEDDQGLSISVELEPDAPSLSLEGAHPLGLLDDLHDHDEDQADAEPAAGASVLRGPLPPPPSLEDPSGTGDAQEA